MRRMTTALAVLALSLALAAPALARPATATLDVVAADTVVATADAAGAYAIVGDGFRKNTTVGVAISGERSRGATTDSDGTFSIEWTPSAPGTYELTAYQIRGKSWELVTSITVTVD